MTDTEIIILGVMTFNLLWALYTTFGKEKLMIEHGEGSLPASTYSFIILRHVVRALLLVGGLREGLKLTGDLTPVGYFTFIFVLAFLVELVSAVVETVIRTVYLNHQYKKLSEKD